MATFVETLRARSKELSEAADLLINAADFGVSAEKRVTAVVGKVNAQTFSIAADVVEYLEAKTYHGITDVNRQRIFDQYHALRLAAAKGIDSGDWTDFEQLINAGTNSG
jgi:hypothetical protein